MNIYFIQTHLTQVPSTNNSGILRKLESIDQKLAMQNTLRKLMLNSTEAAQYLSISRGHLYRLTSRRLIPHHRPLGRLYFLRCDLDAFMQRNRVITRTELQQAVTTFLKLKDIDHD